MMLRSEFRSESSDLSVGRSEPSKNLINIHSERVPATLKRKATGISVFMKQIMKILYCKKK